MQLVKAGFTVYSTEGTARALRQLGIEVTQVAKLSDGDGETIPDLVVAWRHDGPGPDEEASQVLVVHALTGSADAAGDWWEPLIGPGRALDTDRIGVLSANVLGGRYGTTGPTSVNPATGAVYGREFPAVTVRDQARVQWTLLDALGIGRLEIEAPRGLPIEPLGDTRLPVGVLQRILDGQLHVGWAELGDDRTVDVFYQGMHDRLRMDDHADLVRAEVEEPAGLDDLQGLVHFGEAVLDDLHLVLVR